MNFFEGNSITSEAETSISPVLQEKFGHSSIPELEVNPDIPFQGLNDLKNNKMLLRSTTDNDILPYFHEVGHNVSYNKWGMKVVGEGGEMYEEATCEKVDSIENDKLRNELENDTQMRFLILTEMVATIVGSYLYNSVSDKFGLKTNFRFGGEVGQYIGQSLAYSHGKKLQAGGKIVNLDEALGEDNLIHLYGNRFFKSIPKRVVSIIDNCVEN